MSDDFAAESQSIEMTDPAWRRAFVNVLIWGTGLLATDAALTIIISRRFPIEVFPSFLIATFVLATLGSGWHWWSRVRGERAAGPLLLDCGTVRPRAMFGAWTSSGPHVAMICLTSVFVMTGGFTSTAGWPYMALMVLCLVAQFAMDHTIGHLQIRAGGIRYAGGLIRWDRIESWSWTGESDATLLIQSRGFVPFLGRAALPIPVALKGEVEGLLNRYRP